VNNLDVQIKYPFDTTWVDYPDDSSLAVICYFMGCSHNCQGCHNPLFQLMTYSGARSFTIKELYGFLFDACCKNKTNKVVLSGGDVLFHKNVEFVKTFVKLYSNIFSFCLYTGSSIKEVKQFDIKGFKFIKVGEYKEDLKQESVKTDVYFQLASSNQEIYDGKFNLLTKKGRLRF